MDEKVPLEPPPDYEAATEKSGQPAPGSRPRGPLPFKLPALDSLKGKRIGLTDVEIIPSGAPEDFPKSLSPFEYVLRTAESKAMAVYEKEIDSPKGAMSILISADTIVLSPIGSTILEKPRSEKHHIDMLQGLRNAGAHKVYTAVVCMSPRDDAVSPGYRIETHVEETTVRFDSSITDDLILAYVKTREGSQLAGGYGIQGLGAILVDGIDGDFYNVVGLPIKSTLQLIEKVMSPSDEELELEEEE